MTATVHLGPFPIFQAFDENGDPLAGGKLYTYQANSSTPLVTYSDAGGSSQNTNPVILDANGKANVYFLPQAYKLNLTDSSDVQQSSWPVDNYYTDLGALANTSDSTLGDALIGVKNTASGGTARTQHTKNLDYLTPEDFGAIGDGVTDDATALTNAVAAAIASNQRLVGRGTYRIASSVNLRKARIDFGSAFVYVDEASSMLILGGDSQQTSTNPRQDLGYIFRTGGATSTPTCRIAGTKDQVFSISGCDYLQLYADTATGDSSSDNSIAYCTMFLGKIDTLEFNANKATTHSTTQWINENTIFLQRCTTFLMDGTYQHNHNKIYGGSFENTSSIHFAFGRDNFMYGIRWESATSGTVTFDSGTSRNVLIKTYAASDAADPTSLGPTITDNGVDNVYYDSFFDQHHAEVIGAASINDVVLDTQTGPYTSRTPDLQRIYSSVGSVPLTPPNVTGVKANTYIRWTTVGTDNSTTDGTNNAYRCRLEFYDAKMVPVTADASYFTNILGGMTTLSTNTVTSSSNQPYGMVRILAAGVTAGIRFVKAYWRMPGSPATASSKAVRLMVTKFTPHSSDFNGYANSLSYPVAPVLTTTSAIPTKGFAPVGWLAYKSDKSATYMCTFALDTTLSVAALSGATTITVTSGTGTVNGDIIGVNQDDGSTLWTTISSGGGTTGITLTDPLTANAANGSRVVFNRWA